MLSAANIILEVTDRETGKVRAPEWHVRYQYPFYLLASLYRTEFAGNVHYRRPEVFGLSLKMARTMMATRNGQGLYEGGNIGGGDYGFLEWPVYFLCRTVRVLGGDLLEDDAGLAKQAITEYIESALPKPFGFTSPNHDAWRLLDELLAAEVCGRPEWADAARFGMHRLIAYQRPEGFWEESRHHGPSTSYNYTMLRPLYHFHRVSGDEVVGEAAGRLIDYMTMVAFPDGTGIAAFDGRQAYGVGTPAPILSLTPKGRRLIRLLLKTREQMKASTPEDPHYSGSNWNSHHRMAASADDAQWIDDMTPDEEPLECERDGWRWENHSQALEAAIHRTGAWCMAAGGTISDIPILTGSVYRLQRQSRLDVWHERCGLMVGGGSSGGAATVPLANVHVVTGFNGTGCEFGKASGDDRRAVQKMFFPDAARTCCNDNGLTLDLDFLHAHVRAELKRIDDEELLVVFDVEPAGVKRLLVQLPVVVFDGVALDIDGSPAAEDPGKAQPVKDGIAVKGTPRGGAFQVSLCAGERRCAVRYPVEPLRSYRGLESNERYRSLYRIALVSCQIDVPSRRESIVFRARVTG